MSSTLVRSRRTVAAIALAAVAALALSGCGGAADATDDAASGIDAASATSLAAFGTLEELEAAAAAEGQLNVIALPRDWANYGEILDLFAERYPDIIVTEQSPDISSAEEIQAAETNEGLDTAPDVFDLGLTVALDNTDGFAPYKVQTWGDIPDALKEPSGLFVGGYGGYLSIGYDSARFDAPEELDDLLSDDFRGAVAINGDPTQAGSAFAAVGLATGQEFLYSDEVQNLWLKGGARPARMEAMIAQGTIDDDLAASLPAAPEEIVVPTEEQSSVGGTLLGEKWDAAVFLGSFRRTLVRTTEGALVRLQHAADERVEYDQAVRIAVTPAPVSARAVV